LVQIFKLAVYSIALCLVASGCETLNKSTAAGAGVGATAGAVAGSFMPGDDSSKPRNVIFGAATGAVIGALGGALIHKNMEEHERAAFEKGKSTGTKGSGLGTVVSSSGGYGSRRYFPPKIERRWVDDDIHGNVLIESHYEQVIVEEGHWD
jgi:hypothetical protein